MKGKVFITLFFVMVTALTIGIMSEYLFPFTQCYCSPVDEISNFNYMCYADHIYIGYKVDARYCNINFCKSEYTVLCREMLADGYSRDYGVYHEDEAFCNDCDYGTVIINNPIGADGEPMWQ